MFTSLALAKLYPSPRFPICYLATRSGSAPTSPPTQSVHYLLVVAFLRGTTNPPPDNWFTEIQTWNKNIREEGVTITVPAEAQQVILFLAPETSGDFSTLRSAVRGRPGIFVRASQDLIESGFEQARIETYLAAIRRVPPDDTKGLAEHSELLSRTLNLKPNGDCFKRPVDSQSTCLTQAGNQTLLDDGHGQSVADTLNDGSNSDLINQASYTRLAGGRKLQPVRRRHRGPDPHHQYPPYRQVPIHSCNRFS